MQNANAVKIIFRHHMRLTRARLYPIKPRTTASNDVWLSETSVTNKVIPRAIIVMDTDFLEDLSGKVERSKNKKIGKIESELLTWRSSSN